MTVKTILSQKGYAVETIGPQSTVAETAKRLSERRIGAIIVVDGKARVIGMLSERDIVRTLAERGPGALELPIESIMTRRVVTCAEADTVGEIMERMTSGKFRHLPVMDGERLIGVISIGDVVKHRVGEIEAETNAMRDYILTA
jgi:CBS domain-containing protein